MRLLSWNVQWCRGMDGIADPARIVREARLLGDPDVLCLQEVNRGFELPGTSGEDQVEALQHELPGYAVFYASAIDVPGEGGTRLRFGNLLASRLPVGRVLRHTLPWPPTDTPSMPRGALEVTVHAAFGAVRVTSTHLEYYSSRHRAAQIERLRELHCEANRETANPGEEDGPFRPLARPASAIVCGDFNLPPEDPLHARFVEAFLDGTPKFLDAWEVVHPGKPHAHTFRVHERKGEAPYCCDYVFLTEDIRPRLASISVDGMNRASDHQPVMVELA